MSRRFLFGLLFLLICCAGTRPGPGDATITAPDRPGDGWNIAAAHSVGADAPLLDSMIQDDLDGAWTGIQSILMFREDSLVLEEHFGSNDRDTFHEIRSATKSIGSILVGIASDQGVLASVETPVHTYFADDEPDGGWDRPVGDVTLRHLHTRARSWNGSPSGVSSGLWGSMSAGSSHRRTGPGSAAPGCVPATWRRSA